MNNTDKQRNAGRPKSEEKRNLILQAATQLLLQHGYSKTSMESVAKASGVSKQTVYSHFSNKDMLYNAVIENKCQEYRIEETSICVDTQPLSEILENIGTSFIRLHIDKSVIAMYKILIGESKPGSHEAKLFYDAGPLHTIDMLAKLLTIHPSSQLSPEQARETALDFFNLLKGDFHLLSILHLPYQMNPEDELKQAQKATRKILAIIKAVKQD